MSRIFSCHRMMKSLKACRCQEESLDTRPSTMTHRSTRGSRRAIHTVLVNNTEPYQSSKYSLVNHLVRKGWVSDTFVNKKV